MNEILKFQVTQVVTDAFNGGPAAEAIAKRVIAAILDAGWIMAPPKDAAGVCPRCRNYIEEGTHHTPFNGNQMFACEIVHHVEENFDD